MVPTTIRNTPTIVCVDEDIGRYTVSASGEYADHPKLAGCVVTRSTIPTITSAMPRIGRPKRRITVARSILLP